MPDAVKMEPDRIADQLKGIPEWSGLDGSIQRTFAFADFLAAMAFVNRVADHAERVQHHPDILIRYNKVTLTLSTHDAGGLTIKDFDFAAAAESLM